MDKIHKLVNQLVQSFWSYKLKYGTHHVWYTFEFVLLCYFLFHYIVFGSIINFTFAHIFLNFKVVVVVVVVVVVSKLIFG